MHTPNPDIPNIPNTPEVAMPLSFGPARPVVLFPVRLETRFFPLADGSSELRVRVYPDTVHIDTHEPELTADELTWGQHFWEQTWRAANDEERGKAAWRQLADRFDPPRAAWIARALKPLNPEDRPANPVAADQPLPKPPRFPSPATKAETWTRAPAARVLPNQWIVLGYKNGRLVVNVKGRLIPDPLATGPDPSPSANVDPLGIDDGMQWMVDFDAAEKVGMGIRAKLTREDAAAGLDFVLVLGIKDSLDGTTDWTPHLAELFDAHHYTDGLSFVPQGTPSNNTEDAPSGFSSKDPGHEASYLAERTAPAFQPGDGSNADVLTTALGLANAGPVFANLPNATAKEQLDARHMNTALWQATWGYFLLQMLGVGATNESPLTDDDIAWVRSHFIDYVRASGPLPALRVGKQPYGILPVTSLNAWKAPADQQSQSARDVALRDFLIRLRDLWRRNFPEVPRLGRTRGYRSGKGHRQRPGRSPEHGRTVVQLLDATPDGTPLPGTPMGVFERRILFRTSGNALIEEPPPEPSGPGRSRSPRRTCLREKGSLGSEPGSRKGSLSRRAHQQWTRVHGGTHGKGSLYRPRSGPPRPLGRPYTTSSLPRCCKRWA